MESSAQLDVGNADLVVTLPVSGFPAVVLPPLELEHVDLGLLPFAHDLTGDLGSAHQRSAGLDGLAVGGEEHLVEGDLRAGFGAHQRELERLPLLCPELLSTGANDRV